MERQELIRLEEVEKSYGRNRVLVVDALSLREGDQIVLSGQNGSGKSTLLKILGGIIPVERGRVWKAVSLRDETVGYVPQSGGLYSELSVQDNLRLRSRLYGRLIDNEKDAWFIRELGLSMLLTKRFEELSGGYQRLAAIAAALHVEPTWLLLDEPFAGIDHKKHDVLLQRLSEVMTDLRLLVLATPDHREFPLANKWMRIEEGRVLCSEL